MRLRLFFLIKMNSTRSFTKLVLKSLIGYNVAVALG